jgi:hypothetical protein
MKRASFEKKNTIGPSKVASQWKAYLITMFNLISISILFPSSIFNVFPHKLTIFQSFISKNKFNIGSSIIGI